MAVTENLKAFENLKETTKGSLDAQEKADLNKISSEDIKAEKDEVGNKTFEIDGTQMKLEDIVKNLKFDASGSAVTLNGKSIAWGSELGAAIQVYAIAQNKSIGSAGIDGKVGRETVRGLQSAQNAVSGNEGKNSELLEGQKLSMKELGTHNFIPEFNKLNKRGDMENLHIIDDDGCLNLAKNYANGGAIVDSDGYCSVKYISQVDQQEKSIKVKVDKDANKNVDALQFANKIENVVSDAEKALAKATEDAKIAQETLENNSVVENGIKSFKEDNITNPLIKKWAKLNKMNFSCVTRASGTIEVRSKAKNGMLLLTTSSKNLLDENGKFDARKFNAKLDEQCNQIALEAIKKHFDNSMNAVNNTRIANASDANNVAQKYAGLMKEIKECDPNNQLLNETMTKINDLKQTAETKNYCYQILNNMNADISSLNSMNGVLTTENKQKVISILGKYSDLAKQGTGKFDYRYSQSPKQEYSKKFSDAKMSQDYEDKLKKMADIAEKYEIEISQVN